MSVVSQFRLLECGGGIVGGVVVMGCGWWSRDRSRLRVAQGRGRG